jgi:hypothetical protein
MSGVIEPQSLFGKPPDCDRVDAVLLCQYPGSESADRIMPEHGYPCLQYNRAAIDGLGHEVDAGPVLFTASLEYPPVCMQAGEIRQQGGVNIKHPSPVVAYKRGGQDPHEACQHNKGGLEAFNTFQ